MIKFQGSEGSQTSLGVQIHSQIAVWVAAKPWKSSQISRFWRPSNLTWRVMGRDFFSGPFADRGSSTRFLTFFATFWCIFLLSIWTISLGNTPDFGVHQKSHIFKKGKLLLARSRLYQRILKFCKYCATRDDVLHPIVSKAAASGHENVENCSFRTFRNHRPRTQALTPYPLPLLPETGRNEEWRMKNDNPTLHLPSWKLDQ